MKIHEKDKNEHLIQVLQIIEHALTSLEKKLK